MLKERQKNIAKDDSKEKIKFLSFYLKANSATVSPPLSSVLGNIGLNTSNFCKEFNKLTEDLADYIVLKVFLKVNLSSRTWVIKLGKMPITYIFRLISKKKKKKYYGSGGFFFKELYYITLLDFFLVILFFNKIITISEIKNKLAILKSMDIVILINKENITETIKNKNL